MVGLKYVVIALLVPVLILFTYIAFMASREFRKNPHRSITVGAWGVSIRLGEDKNTDTIE